jgi:hypothetical protein
LRLSRPSGKAAKNNKLRINKKIRANPLYPRHQPRLGGIDCSIRKSKITNQNSLVGNNNLNNFGSIIAVCFHY